MDHSIVRDGGEHTAIDVSGNEENTFASVLRNHNSQKNSGTFAEFSLTVVSSITSPDEDAMIGISGGNSFSDYSPVL